MLVSLRQYGLINSIVIVLCLPILKLSTVQ